MKKLFLSAAVFLLALFLPACSEPESGQGIDELLSGEISSVRFAAEKLSFWDESLKLTRAVRTGDSLVLAGMDGELRHHFYRFEPASGKLSPVEGLAVSGVESIDGVSSGEAYILYTGEDSCRRIINIAADNSWSEAPLTLPDELAQDYFYNVFFFDGAYLLNNGRTLFLLDSEGKEAASLGPYDSPISVVRRADDSVLLASCFSGKTSVQILGPGLSVAAEYTLDGEYEFFLPGGSGNELYAQKGDIVYRLDLEAGAKTSYVDLFKSGNACGEAFVPLGDGLFFDSDYSGPALWRPASASAAKTLTLAALFSHDHDYISEKALRDAIKGFNKENGEYYIELADYALYNETENADTGYNIFSTDINAGNTPDIYDLYTLGGDLSSRGALEDLKPFFEADAELGLAELEPSIVAALEENGRLFQLVPSFTFTTMYGRKSVAGPGKISIERFMDLADDWGAAALFDGGMTRSEYFINVLINSSSEFIDYPSASCNFAAEGFIRHLEFAAMLPEEIEPNKRPYYGAGIYAGKNPFIISTTDEPIFELLKMGAIFRDDFCSVGFPSDTGSGVSMTPTLCLGMASDSEVQEGVWEFFKYLLGNGYQWNCRQLPVVSDILSQRLDAAVLENQGEGRKQIGMYTLSEDGQPGQDLVLSTKPADSGTKAEALEIISQIDSVNEYDVRVYEIILGEAAKFYNGVLSASEAAENIQARASIYLSEQYG